jgi:hypothetical protein
VATFPPGLDAIPPTSPDPQDGAGPAQVIVTLAAGISSAPSPSTGKTDVVGIACTRDGRGYYVVEANGTVHAFGDAVQRGDMSGHHLAKPIVGVSVNLVTGGYWLVGGDGGVFAFGPAGFFGSMIGRHLNGAAVGLAGAPDGKGYWIAAADGGLFAFGSARFVGNPVGKGSSPVVGIAPA